MRAISLFSGVGGFDLGLERAGIETVLQAEIDPWCNKVLERHWPQTERVNDVRDVRLTDSGLRSTERQGLREPGHAGIRRAPGEPGIAVVATIERGRADVDLIYGGFPCQDVSVAGKRAGLGGARSGLWFEFHRVLRELRPRWVVIENVPGLLSSNSGRDFGVILGGLDELGFDVAWAVLDARHFGVPQRRRRVFVVGGPDRRRCEQVLSVCESCGGNPETGGAAREGVAVGVGDGAAPTLGVSHGVDNLAKALHAPSRGEKWRGADHDTYVPDVAPTLLGGDNRTGGTRPPGSTVDNADSLQPHANGVRRLTPLECERLQGWPDDWTRWDAAGNEIADSHRYRMIGNGVAAPVAEWIGWRLRAVEGRP